MSDRGVFRTAPATPGLLITKVFVEQGSDKTYIQTPTGGPYPARVVQQDQIVVKTHRLDKFPLEQTQKAPF